MARIALKGQCDFVSVMVSPLFDCQFAPATGAFEIAGAFAYKVAGSVNVYENFVW